MPSLLPGYEYDIFISYRQKDNKYEGWVTEFVDNLKKELEATFKEDLTIYFDINPHDGLLETHDVDRSLEAKLKAVVLIPVISQTYCDPKSFAWRSEFCAFQEMARHDALGLNVRLRSGNITSRILPVKIHDIDAGDKQVLEQQLEGPFRCVEFIYKEAGVNRPLKPGDNRQDNLNKTDYRNQINKTANAIKEIFEAIRQPVSGSTALPHPFNPTRKDRRLLMFGAAMVLVAATGLFLWYSLTHPTKNSSPSIAVLPFENLSNDPEQQYFINGLSDELIGVLGRIPTLKVPGRTSSFKYRSGTTGAKEIGADLGVAHILEGAVQKSGDQLRIAIRMLRASDESTEWSETYDIRVGDILKIEDEVTSAVVRKLKITLLKEDVGKGRRAVNAEAYDWYLRGRERWSRRGDGMKESISFYERAIELDPDFDLPYSGMAESYLMMSFLGAIPDESGIPLCKDAAFKALELNPNSSEASATLGFVYMIYEWDFETAAHHFRKAIRINPNNDPALYWYSIYQIQVAGNLDSARILAQRAVEIEPLYSVPHNHLGYSYNYAGNCTEAISEQLKSFNLDKNYFLSRHALAQAYACAGEYENAVQVLRLNDDNSKLHDWLLIDLSYVYMRLGKKEEARRLYQVGIQRRKEGSMDCAPLGLVAANIQDYSNAIAYMTKARDRKEDLFMLSKNFLLVDEAFQHSSEFLQLVEPLHLPDLKSRFRNPKI